MVTRILLVGLMATGKTTVGRTLAHELGWRYLDNDELVLLAAGAAREGLRRLAGAEHLHEAESAALRQVLAAPAPLVAGVAASVVTQPENRSALRRADTLVVWLRARPETLARRVGHVSDSESSAGSADDIRPWLGADPLIVFERMAADRNPFFEMVSQLTIDVDDMTASEAAHQIVLALVDHEQEPRILPRADLDPL
jgi:shikimate kinase